MEYNNYEVSDELYHHGIKGMRWGIRRFQNKDGSLTNAGKKHRAKLEGESGNTSKKSTSKNATKNNVKSGTKNSAKKDAKNAIDAAPRKKTVSEMTDSELRDKVNRLQNERMYYELERQIAALNPRKVSAGERFAKSLLNDVVAPAAKNAGKAWLEKFMKDKLGLNNEDPINKLEKQVKKLELTKKIADLKKGNEPDNLKELETRYKTLDWEKKIRDLENPKSDNDDLMKALDLYRNTTEDQRKEYKEAAGMFENIDKIRKKGNTKD